MTAQLQFYRARAADARAAAGAATLSNVRDRWLLSEASWMHLADRSLRSASMQEALVAQTASERGALTVHQGPEIS
jgi:hypothetical protein